MGETSSCMLQTTWQRLSTVSKPSPVDKWGDDKIMIPCLRNPLQLLWLFKVSLGLKPRLGIRIAWGSIPSLTARISITRLVFGLVLFRSYILGLSLGVGCELGLLNFIA